MAHDRPLARLLTLCVLLSLAGCADDPLAPGLSTDVDTVLVRPSTAAIAVGESELFRASVVNEAGQEVADEEAIHWSVSDRSVIAVSPLGRVSALDLGRAEVRAEIDGHVGVAEVEVVPVPIETLAVTPEQAKLSTGDSVQIHATARDAEGEAIEGVDFRYHSTDRAVAMPDAEGLVTAFAAGQVQIRVTARGDTASSFLTVEWAPVDSLEVRPSTDTVAVASTVRYEARRWDAAGNPIDGVHVAWSVADPTLATVDDSGRVTGERPGRTRVIATSDGKTDSADVVVIPRLDSLVIEPDPLEVGADSGQAELAAIAYHRSGDTVSSEGVVWTSEDPSIATVDEDGVVTGLREGGTRVLAELENASDTADVFVVHPDSVEDPGPDGDPNLTVEAVEVHGRGTLDSEPVAIGGVVRNDGDGDAGSFRWTIRVDGAEEASGTVESVAAGDTARIPDQGPLGPYPEGEHSVTLTIDTDGDVDESDEGDNEGTNRLISYASEDGYTIELEYVTSMESAQQQAFENARDRWSGILTADVDDVSFSAANPGPSCDTGGDERESPVDDLLIYVRVDSIDGPGGVLGRAGPCVLRDASAAHTSVIGGMEFDEADLEQMEEDGILEDVITHEMGHVIGIGTLWGSSFHDLREDVGTTDPIFTGPDATEGFFGVGGDDYDGRPVPLANQGGPGTRDAHWRESTFGDELMTGFVNPDENPLSEVTIRALRDGFYAVDEGEADPYTLPSPSARLGVGGAGGRWLGDDLLDVSELIVVDRAGRTLRRVIRPVWR